MNIKKHYKIFISVIIIIVLISSFIIYNIPENNINYNDNEKNMDLKYFNNLGDYEYKYFKLNNYTISSNYITNNKISYLNSTIVKPYIFSGGCNIYYINYGINIHLKNVNNKYIYLIIKSQSIPHGIFTNNSKIIKTINNDNLHTYKLKIINDNKNITIKNRVFIPFYNDCNVSIKIELNNNFYNLFNINTIKETTIYGTIGLTPECSDSGYFNYGYYADAPYNLYLNSSLFIENNNTHNFHIVPVRYGHFHFFAKPYTEYKLYYLKNNTLEEFKSYDGKNISYIKTGSAGLSTPPASLYE